MPASGTSPPSVVWLAELSDLLSEDSRAEGSSGPKFLLSGRCLSVDRALHHSVFGFFLLSSSWGNALGASAASLKRLECLWQ